MKIPINIGTEIWQLVIIIMIWYICKVLEDMTKKTASNNHKKFGAYIVYNLKGCLNNIKADTQPTEIATTIVSYHVRH